MIYYFAIEMCIFDVIAHVRYIKILTWRWGFRDKIANFWQRHCLAIPRGDLSAKKTKPNRVPKCDVIKNEICEIMGFVKLFWKNNVQDAYLSRISNLGQIVSEILAQLCSDDSIQILLNLTWFLILWTKPNLEGFVWSHRSITGLISQRQFAPNC